MGDSTSASRGKDDGSVERSMKEVQEQMARMREDISVLTQKLGELGFRAKDDLQSRAESLPADLYRTYDNVVEGLKQEYDVLERDVERRIREKPIAAIGLAAALGFLLAMLSRR